MSRKGPQLFRNVDTGKPFVSSVLFTIIRDARPMLFILAKRKLFLGIINTIIFQANKFKVEKNKFEYNYYHWLILFFFVGKKMVFTNEKKYFIYFSIA